MKKWMSILLTALLSIAVLAGCNTENKNESKESEASSDNDNDSKQISALVGLQMEMIHTIRGNLEPVTAYEQSQDATLQEQAVSSSKLIANELRGLEISSDLSKEIQGDMKESVELLALYFEERAATLKPDADLTAMEAALAAFHEKIGATFEKAGLHAPNFEKDVN
jgi:hypothetical protein